MPHGDRIMARYEKCFAGLRQAAGRDLTDDELIDIYTRLNQAARDIKAGRVDVADVDISTAGFEKKATASTLFEMAAERAAKELVAEAKLKQRQAALQVTKLAARADDVVRLQENGLSSLDAVEKILVRDYSGRINLESLEQKVTGYKSYFNRKLLATWDALGDDFLGFFQDRTKLIELIKELRGEESGNALAKKGAKAFHDVAEEARLLFNENGGNIGKLDDWGMPQHHSQELVARAGREAWVDAVLPMLDRTRYVDDLGNPFSETEVRRFLGKAWDTIATNGHANREPGQRGGVGKVSNRHAESRQIHFKDAESVITYWEQFGERSAVEILSNHVETMARDIAFVDHLGPNPSLTFSTLRDRALKQATTADPTKTQKLEGRAHKLDELFNYVSGKTKASANPTVSAIADGIAHLNTAGKLGGAVLASLFGDKPMMEAVAHMNNLPAFQRWQTELALLNPANSADRRLLQQQGLMLDSVRSGLQRFYEGLGDGGGGGKVGEFKNTTGKLANAVMRVTGMQAINDIRKGAFGVSLMTAIGNEIKNGVEFSKLPDSDIRTLRNYGISESDWNVWRLADLDDMGRGNDAVLTPESISRVPEEEIKAAGLTKADQRNAIVKLLGAVNTESEFAIVTPGWKERSAFYGDLQRGTVKGEIARSILQFKSFPWAMLQRGMDAIANQETPTSKAAMTAYLVTATTIAGAMLMQTRDMLSGKDPRKMVDEDWYKFWGAAFLQGGALGIYGDFLYGANQTRYGSGPLEALAGPTVGPLLELGIVQPLNAAKNAIEGKETHLAAQSFQDLKGFIPGGNIWYLKTALDHLIWQNVMEALSPGYLNSMRSRTRKEYGQSWWWEPGEVSPDRAPDLGAAVSQ